MDNSRTSIDWAVGVLIALRGYSPEEAFAELVSHSYTFDVSLLQSARSLVAAARDAASEAGAAPMVGSGSGGSSTREWGEVVADRRPMDGIENVA